MSTERLLINTSPFETRIAVVSQGVTQEIHIQRTHQKSIVGSIFLGKVMRVLPGMQSAFIDIGQDKAGFIHLGDLHEYRQARLQQSNPSLAIEKILFEGQIVLVQAIKDRTQNKGPRLTNQISLPGRMLVYTPQNSHIGVSQKLCDEQEREQLKQKLLHLLGPDEKGGFIIRTYAGQSTEHEWQEDIRYLKNLWQHIKQTIQTTKAPALLHEDLSLMQRALRDFVDPDTEAVEIDHEASYHALHAWATQFTPNIADKIQYYQSNISLFDRYHIEEDIRQALSRRVDLKSGGYLIIDQNEALTSIDVNTGAFTKGRNYHDTVLKTNLEACVIIARQLKIRNLGGIIIVDFIDMENTEHQNMVLDALKSALNEDYTRTTISQFSTLGLVEITRKRTRESLSRILCEPCPTCHARGDVLTARSICYDILREIAREALQFNPKEFRVIANQAVIDLFLDEESEFLAQLSEEIGKPITLAVESLYAQETYDVVLMT